MQVKCDKPSVEDEYAMFCNFILKEKRSRYKSLFSPKKKRNKLISRWNIPSDDFNVNNFIATYKSKVSDLDLFNELQLLGAPNTCYIVSQLKSLDASYHTLLDAIQEARCWPSVSLIICIENKLALLSVEDIHMPDYILKV